MTSYKPTRMELLKVRKKKKLAEKGHKLLKQKRDVLVMEFFSTLKEIKKLRLNISDKLYKAQLSLYNAAALEGSLDIERLSLGLAEDVSIDISSERVMGVDVPKLKDIKVGYQWPGYYEQSVELDNAIVKYRKLFPDVMKLAEKQLILDKMAAEIKKAKRRVNALEYLILPKLEEAQKGITFRLAELERENFARLKLIKKQKQD
ncbi:V-type ATP synthase subunit D [Candidatus Woesearchaeota archaeon]|nr:V-type ATP synthase subunit D [Candidatus Woesearchaeota archaeon]